MSSCLSLLSPRNDVVFKLLFTRNPDLLRSMLEAVLAERIVSFTVLNPELPGDLSGDKNIVLDIRVLLENGARVDVEMQVRVTPELRARLLYYAARDYTQQLSRGDAFEALTPTVLVVWLDQPLTPQIRSFHRVFELREQRSGELFSNHLAIHVLQLRDWRSAVSHLGSVFEAALQRWARFLSVETPEQLTALALEDPTMSQAAHSLEHLSQDPEAARLAREREDSTKFYNLGLAMSRQEGLVEGRQEGLRQSILQLCRVFDIEVTPERETLLNRSADELSQLLEVIARHRAWPEP